MEKMRGRAREEEEWLRGERWMLRQHVVLMQLVLGDIKPSVRFLQVLQVLAGSLPKGRGRLWCLKQEVDLLAAVETTVAVQMSSMDWSIQHRHYFHVVTPVLILLTKDFCHSYRQQPFFSWLKRDDDEMYWNFHQRIKTRRKCLPGTRSNQS